MSIHVRFLDRLIEEGGIRKLANNRDLIALERMGNHLFGIPFTEDKKPIRKVTPREMYFVEIFRGYNEIYSTYYRLELVVQFLMKISPRRAATVDEISYHVEKYFEEMYVLKERIITLLRLLTRKLQKQSKHASSKALKELESNIEKSFDGPIKIQGSHTHKSRFTDDELYRLKTLDLLVVHGRMQELALYRKQIIKSVVRKWRATIREINKKTKTILETLFEEHLAHIIFVELAPAS